jgi:hypothetical protein
MRDSAIIYRSFYEAIKELPVDVQATVWQAICEYSLNFELIELDGIGQTVFRLIRPQLDANLKRYANGSKPKLMRTGSKVPAKPKQAVSETVANDNNNDNDNVNANGNGKTIAKAFVPPTILDWVTFFKEHGYREDVAYKSWQSYDVANWRDSRGNAIKNWRQKALHVWFKDEHKAVPKTDKTATYTNPSNYRPA